MKRYLLIKNIGRLVTMTGEGEGELGVFKDVSCLLTKGHIECFGKECELPQLEDYLVEELDAGGGVVMPGLIDCHTHLIHAGSRQGEAAERARGKTYSEIARAGGGILSTVRATRAASMYQLCDEGYRRADEALEKGVTTIEVKSGYGLNTDTEIRMLKAVKWFNENHALSFVPTFLGAHAIPEEYKDKREKYVDLIIDEMIPLVATDGLAKFCDVFVEEIAFTPGEARRIFEAGKAHGLVPKLHADQMTSDGGAKLAAEVGAISADHLDYISDEGIDALAAAGVVPVVIPCATFYLGGRKYAPARKMIDKGLPVAVSTDYNPGTAPTLDLFLAATIAASYNGMTMEECLKGITINAAKALNITDGRGTIVKGGVADLVVLNAPDEYFPIYRFGASHVRHVIKEGKIKYSKSE